MGVKSNEAMMGHVLFGNLILIAALDWRNGAEKEMKQAMSQYMKSLIENRSHWE